MVQATARRDFQDKRLAALSGDRPHRPAEAGRLLRQRRRHIVIQALCCARRCFRFRLKRNVIDIYSFCCRNYQPGDKLYGFGFSRGAFTIRIVAGLIARIGLVPYHGDDRDLARDAATAYREYRRKRDFHSGIFVRPVRAVRDFINHTILRKPTLEAIHPTPIDRFEFLGVWDTVDAYGGPIEEITRAIDYYYLPLSMPDQFMNYKIWRACHALALEEERDAFKPVLWDDRYVRRARPSN